jgi:outer membrane murein-binding lipoprotein Lpp
VVGLVALILVVLVLTSLVFSGCIGKKKTDDTSTLVTLESVASRVAALESATVNYALKSELNAYVAQDDVYTRSEMDGLLEGVLEGLDDIAAPDLSGYVTQAEYDALAARVAALEGGGGGSGGGGSTSGQVTAVFDPSAPAIVSGSGLPIQQFNVIINNGTSTWQYVGYSIILTVKNAPPTTGATLTNLASMTLNTVFTTSLTFTASFVTNGTGNVTQITFYPVHGVASAPGTVSASILNYLDFALPAGVAIQEWNCTIIPVYSTSNW